MSTASLTVPESDSRTYTIRLNTAKVWWMRLRRSSACSWPEYTEGNPERMTSGANNLREQVRSRFGYCQAAMLAPHAKA